jgi:hypothetical protein
VKHVVALVADKQALAPLAQASQVGTVVLPPVKYPVDLHAVEQANDDDKQD